MNARTFERLGVRLQYDMTTRLTGEMRLPCSDRQGGPIPAQPVLDRTIELARYYESNNWVRFSLLVPLIIGLGWVHWAWHTVFLLALVSMHLLSVILEHYKRALCRELRPFADPEPPADRGEDLTPVRGGWLYDPKRFETAALYRVLGVEFFRKVMEAWADCTRLTRQQREEGIHAKHLERPSRHDLDRFERGTRTNEMMHCCGLVLDVVLAIPYVILGAIPLIALVGAIFLFDLYCAMLQRYLRLRVWGLVRRIRARA